MREKKEREAEQAVADVYTVLPCTENLQVGCLWIFLPKRQVREGHMQASWVL